MVASVLTGPPTGAPPLNISNPSSAYATGGYADAVTGMFSIGQGSGQVNKWQSLLLPAAIILGALLIWKGK